VNRHRHCPVAAALARVSVLPILHEDADLLVINKPADLVCHPSKDGELSSLIGRVRLHLGNEATPHLVNRLDRETSGVILVAKSSGVARALGKLWQARQVRKEYVALVHGHVVADQGTIDTPLGKDVASRVAIKDCVRADGAASRTDYQVLQHLTHENADFSLLRVLPRTGRKHQIRIHLAHLGHPIVGDKLYGGDEDCYLALVERRLTAEHRARLLIPHHALHARSVSFQWKGVQREFYCEPETWLEAWLV
jgi:23S rRNA pseudouridine1911/1915/1917 synthase